MAIKDPLLLEFDHEMGATRRVLERVPDDRESWRPHARSKTMGELAGHIADLPGFVGSIIALPSFDFVAGGRPKPTGVYASREALAKFDSGVVAARAAIDATTDEQMKEKWTLRRGDKTIFTLPRVGVLRTLLLSHVIHHRGQLTVYLRLNDVPVPAIYGPSADEG